MIINIYNLINYSELFYKLIDNNSNELIVELINSGVLNGENDIKSRVRASQY